MGMINYFEGRRAAGLMPPSDKAIPVEYLASREEAQAMANFLWNEKCRHREDIDKLLVELDDLNMLWNVVPEKRRRFVATRHPYGEDISTFGREPAGFKSARETTNAAATPFTAATLCPRSFTAARESEPTPGELDVLEFGQKGG